MFEKKVKKRIEVIADPGSCHLGSKDLAKQLIKAASDSGADAIKFQLFKNKPPNIALDYDYFPELVEVADDHDIEIFASVWDREGIDLLNDCGCKKVKFAFGSNDIHLFHCAAQKLKIYQSGDVNTTFYPGAVKLFCIPEYPVQFVVAWEDIFSRHDGLSDHTLGFTQTMNALNAGAEIVEKHIKLDGFFVPDDNFALTPKEFEQMVKGIQKYEDINYRQ